MVIALSYLSSLPTSYTMVFFSLDSQFFREPSLFPCHLFSSQWSTWWPPLLSLHTLLLLDSVVGGVLGMTSLFEGTRICLVPADLISPCSCFPRRIKGQRHRVAGQQNVIWGGKGCAIPLASQGSEPQQTNCAEWSHLVSGWQAIGFCAGQMAEPNSVFKMAFVFRQLLGHHGWYDLPCKAGTLNRILEFFLGYQCLVNNAKLNQIF